MGFKSTVIFNELRYNSDCSVTHYVLKIYIPATDYLLISVSDAILFPLEFLLEHPPFLMSYRLLSSSHV